MDQATKEELARLERRYWQAMKDGDAHGAAVLSADPCIVASASGVGRLGRETVAKRLEAAQWKLESFELSHIDAELLTSDVAVVAYEVHEDVSVDGQRLTLDAADSSTWVRREGKWLCAVHTESLAGDPFGRDRR